mgnify:FL=1
MSKLIVVTGPSGVGKTTLGKFLIQNLNLKKIITCTTRKIRTGERNGVDYNFFSQLEFKNLIEENRLAEHANVYGNLYGILKNDIYGSLESSHSLVIVDVQGAENIKKIIKKDIFVVFLLPPSRKEISEKISKRNQDSIASYKKRIDFLKKEILWSSNADVEIINDDLEKCKKELGKVVSLFLEAS